MEFKKIIDPKKAFVFLFDNVIYPEKDYLLQVYYLFAEFMAYSEQKDSKAILAFMQEEFSINGKDDIFDKTKTQFGLADKYQENFERLHVTARLPLKLLLYKQVLAFLQELVVERKSIYLILEGNAEVQINKVKQLEWNGLEQYLKLYFTQEFAHSVNKTLDFVIEENKLNLSEILVVTDGELRDGEKVLKSIETISVSKLLFN